MTIHHDIALALSVLLVLGCLILLRCGITADTKDTIKDIISFATTIAVATFAHAQGVKAGVTATRAKDNGDGPK